MKERLYLGCLVLALAVLVSVPASAQTPVPNPTTVTFNHIDFATASGYTGGYFALPVKADHTCDTAATPGATPAQSDDLGKPATTTGVGMSTALVARPIGCYVYKVRALDVSGLYSAWSDPSGPFVREPGAPSAVATK